MCVLLVVSADSTASWPWGVHSWLKGEEQLAGQMFWGKPPLSFPKKSQSSVWPQASRVGLILHTESSTEHQQNPFPSFRVVWRGWCQGLGPRRDGPAVCAAAQFLYPCVTLLFLFYLLCLCLLCSLVELEKEVNNIKTGLKAVETVSIWRFPKCHAYNISLRIRGTIYFMIR